MRVVLYILFSLILSTPAFAQEAGNDKEEKIELKNEEDIAKPKKAKSQKGILSFLNFSFDKKKAEAPIKNTSNQPPETFLEKTTRLADGGDADAQLTLGYMYLYGESGAEINYQKAFRYYAMAAAQDNMVALNNLGSLYFSGAGVKKDVEKAVVLFDKASKLGNVESSVNLAFIYLNGKDVDKNFSESMMLFSRAAEQGSPVAQFILGYAYYRGFVVKQNYTKAFELIKQAADADYDDAEYITAIMYINGEGTTKNYGQAVKYLNRSIAQGNIVAMMELGNILALGAIYPKDIFRSHVIFNVASSYGAIGAAERRDSLEKILKIEQILQAHNDAETFHEKPSELTVYIRNTFGRSIRSYIDSNMRGIKKN